MDRLSTRAFSIGHPPPTKDGISQYQLVITEGFKKGLERLPREIYPIIDRQLTQIVADPFARNPNATRMKNAPSSFRVRIGRHVRMLYRVYSQARRVEIKGIGMRGGIYELEDNGTTALTRDEVEDILKDIRGEPHKDRPPPTRPPLPRVTVEELSWISRDELFFLHVPADAWPQIINAASIEGLAPTTLDPAIKALIEDYWTQPLPTQVEKLYALSPGQGAESIAEQPLSHFLIALDPEQQQALRKLKADGPYLIKGGAGTGKTLIGLYHIRDLVVARTGESLFDAAPPLFGIITYTNTLVDANRALLQALTPTEVHARIRCSTIDKIAYELTERALGRRPNALDTTGISNWIQQCIRPSLAQDVAGSVDRIGFDYVADEIENFIFANDLRDLGEYLRVERKGRQRALREQERTAIWKVTAAFKQLCEERNVQTFQQWRILALHYLKEHPEHPRFAVLFVDEAQDFSKVARLLCLELVRDPRYLLLAADTAQSIYTVPLSWRQTDGRFNFTRRKPIPLAQCYRATTEISRAIASLRRDPGDDDDRSPSAIPVFSGPKPRWMEAPRNEHAGIVADEVARLVRGPGPPLNAGQIGIVVRDDAAIERFLVALKERQIPATKVAKGAPLRIHGEQAHVMTAHASKGLSFPVVFVAEVHAGAYPWKWFVDKAKDEHQRQQFEDQEQRLLYVALSRASHKLYMIVDATDPSPFLVKLDRNAHWI
jgi:superfamily I DNA/RNA helicase/mRNA-degrading endonuclease RelE of RelBE toxin-antitoxin system